MEDRPIVQEARRLDALTSLDGTAPDHLLVAYAAFLLRVTGGGYTSLRAGAPLRGHGEICVPFYFGSAPSLSGADMRALLWAAEPKEPRNLRWYEGNVVMVVRGEGASLWTRETAVSDADAMFLDLLRMGY
jgi:hypothetical protein